MNLPLTFGCLVVAGVLGDEAVKHMNQIGSSGGAPSLGQTAANLGGKALQTLTGKASWFNDTTTASGITGSGIAVMQSSTLRGWWRVTDPKGQVHIEQQTDIGPAHWTGRVIDLTPGALSDFGYSTGSFPTDAGQWKLEYLGMNKP